MLPGVSSRCCTFLTALPFWSPFVVSTPMAPPRTIHLEYTVGINSFRKHLPRSSDSLLKSFYRVASDILHSFLFLFLDFFFSFFPFFSLPSPTSLLSFSFLPSFLLFSSSFYYLSFVFILFCCLFVFSDRPLLCVLGLFRIYLHSILSLNSQIFCLCLLILAA